MWKTNENFQWNIVLLVLCTKNILITSYQHAINDKKSYFLLEF